MTTTDYPPGTFPPDVPPQPDYYPAYIIEERYFVDPEWVLDRPLALYNQRAYYLASYMSQGSKLGYFDYFNHRDVRYYSPEVEGWHRLSVVRDDGHVFGIEGATPLVRLGFGVVPSRVRVPLLRLWGKDAIKAYREGKRPEPAAVFGRMVEVLEHFLDFDGGLSVAPSGPEDQRGWAEALAVMALTTWMTPALDYLPRLWLTGDGPGAASRALALMAQLCYLGTVLSGPQMPAAVRELAASGATLAYDNADEADRPGGTPPALRTWRLAVTSRGTVMPTREYDHRRHTWHVRNRPAHCAHLFAGGGPPAGRLAAECIGLRVATASDAARVARDPQALMTWPTPFTDMIDDLWATALANLQHVAGFDERVMADGRQATAKLGPWRPLLPVGLWLSENGAPGLYDRLLDLAARDNAGRRAQTGDDFTRLIAAAAGKLLGAAGGEHVDVSALEIIKAAGELLDEDSEVRQEDLTRQRVGRLLARLGVRHAPRPAEPPKPRRWRVTGKDVERWNAT